KCLRTLDIEEVGKTTRHATFFQMLGNWSFGDYFKHEMIPWAWELLTRPESDGGFGFPEDRLWATVLPNDTESFQVWRHVVGLPGVDNLYEIDSTWKILDRAAELTEQKYGADHRTDVALRVVADHVRSAVMLVDDGVLPSNEARGYVLRRILRRSIRNLRTLSGGQRGGAGGAPSARGQGRERDLPR